MKRLPSEQSVPGCYVVPDDRRLIARIRLYLWQITAVILYRDLSCERHAVSTHDIGASVAQWIVNPPQRFFCRGLESRHRRPGLMEGLDA
ncbi:hypothetical protein PoB_006622000 [Plakobranchus ocellatus]|uniref:Transposase n=1 Tax=Plakobranchus ocellatus TaxID=259542 RepID=A0AAV4D6E8_9GAST|nr:hypothetical protein PoB_006622000 [Plakobranchus ocellatus]